MKLKDYMNYKLLICGTCGLFFFVGCVFENPSNEGENSDKPNILFIAVDDLRTSIGAYGDTLAITPNIDKLASQGRLFERHYVHAPACGPSRVALLTGSRSHLHSWDIWEEERQLQDPPQNPVSIGDFFRRNGYRTVSIGKVSHLPSGTMPPNYTQHEVPFSWDVATGPTGEWGTPWRAFFGYAGGHAYNRSYDGGGINSPYGGEAENVEHRLPFEAADVSDTGYPDGLTTNLAIDKLKKLQDSDQPFFLAVGFFKPHLPSNAPARYVNLYDPEQIGLADPANPPENINTDISLHNNYEYTTHYHWPWGEGNIPEEQVVNLRHHYYGTVSYVDAQIGKVLNSLEDFGLEENTIIVLWSDHGFHLGEYGIFSKATLYEFSTLSPLIVKTPDMEFPGVATERIVETIDIYPTLANLLQLPTPENIEGESFKILLENPNDTTGADAAISTWRGFGSSNQIGWTLRTDRYRLIVWKDNDTEEVLQVELYDHETDPHETKNISDENPKIVNQLRSQLYEKLN
jgi:iduronate 2-sulfatase